MKAEVCRYLDLRRKKTDGTFPVKIKVYDIDTRNRKYYPTGASLNEAEFKKVLAGEKLSKDLKNVQSKIDSKKVQIEEIINKMDSFSFSELDKKTQRKPSDGTNVFHHFDEKVKRLLKLEKIKTAGLYKQTAESLKKFIYPNLTIKQIREKEITLHFRKIDKYWLQDYEKWMNDEKNTTTTLSMYLRCLRSIFNAAITDKEIRHDTYPFKSSNNKGYEIRGGTSNKKALTSEELNKLISYKTNDPFIIKARDFWFFIFNAYGMNVRDICQLKHEDIEDGVIKYFRQKTFFTSKKPEQIEVPVNSYMQQVIEKYGTSKDYVFDILMPGMSVSEKIDASDRFVNFINDHMERLKELCKIVAPCTTYAARHSFSTKLARANHSMIFIQQTLGHLHMSTTQNYIGAISQEKKKEVSDTLMDF